MLIPLCAVQGGYDPLLAENVEHFVELKRLAHKMKLISEAQLTSTEDDKEGAQQVTFLRYHPLPDGIAAAEGPSSTGVGAQVDLEQNEERSTGPMRGNHLHSRERALW